MATETEIFDCTKGSGVVSDPSINDVWGIPSNLYNPAGASGLLGYYIDGVFVRLQDVYNDPSLLDPGHTVRPPDATSPPVVFSVPPNPDLWGSTERRALVTRILTTTGALARGAAMAAPPVYTVLTSDAKWKANPNSLGTWFDGTRWHSHPIEFDVLNPSQFIGSFGAVVLETAQGYREFAGYNNDLGWIPTAGGYHCLIPAVGNSYDWGGRRMQAFKIAGWQSTCFEKVRITLQSYDVYGEKKTMRIPTVYGAAIGQDAYLQIGFGSGNGLQIYLSNAYDASQLVGYSIDETGALVYEGDLRRKFLVRTGHQPALVNTGYWSNDINVVFGTYTFGDIVYGNEDFEWMVPNGQDTNGIDQFVRVTGQGGKLYFLAVDDHLSWPASGHHLVEVSVASCAGKDGNSWGAGYFSTTLPEWITTYRSAHTQPNAIKEYVDANKAWAVETELFVSPETRLTETSYPITDILADGLNMQQAPKTLELKMCQMDEWDTTMITKIEFLNKLADPFV